MHRIVKVAADFVDLLQEVCGTLLRDHETIYSHAQYDGVVYGRMTMTQLRPWPSQTPACSTWFACLMSTRLGRNRRKGQQ